MTNCPWLSPPIGDDQLKCVYELDHSGFHSDGHHVFWDNTHPLTTLLLDDDPDKPQYDES